MGKEIGIFGAGVAGLNAAKELVKQGHRVTVMAPDLPDSYRSIYSVLGDCGEVPEGLTRSVPFFRVMTTKGTDFMVKGRQKGGMIDYQGYLKLVAGQLAVGGVKNERLRGYEIEGVKITELPSGVIVRFPGGERRFDRVIDATGVAATICRQVEPAREKENPIVEYVYGGVFRGRIIPEAMIIVIGPVGGTCWVNPSVAGEDWVDIVYSAWGWRDDFPRFLTIAEAGLAELVRYVKKQPGIKIDRDKSETKFQGMIRSCPIPLPQSKLVLPFGEAQGIARPNSGDCFRRITMSLGRVVEMAEGKITPKESIRHQQRHWRLDNFYLRAVLVKMLYQAQGNIGGLADEIGHIMAGNDSAWLTNAAERFVLEGIMGPRMVLLMMSNPVFRKNLIESWRYLFTKWDRAKPYWPLPQN
jgi:hypothetical protein